MSSTLVDHDAPTRPHLPIDPRIHRRRVEVRREEGRRRLRVLLAVSAVVVVAAAALGILHTPLARVRHIRLAGTNPSLSAAQVVAAAGLGARTLMVGVAPAADARRLEAIPAVATATVTRQWPATVRVTLRTRTPVGAVIAGGVRSVLDRTGRVLATGAGAGAGLPLLQVTSGPVPPGGWLAGGAGPGAGALAATTPAAVAARPVTVDPAHPLPGELALAAALGPALQGRVASIAVQGPDSLVATIGTTTAVFGDASSLPAKAAALAAVIDHGPLQGITTIDLRVPDRPVATGPGAASAATAPGTGG